MVERNLSCAIEWAIGQCHPPCRLATWWKKCLASLDVSMPLFFHVKSGTVEEVFGSSYSPLKHSCQVRFWPHFSLAPKWNIWADLGILLSNSEIRFGNYKKLKYILKKYRKFHSAYFRLIVYKIVFNFFLLNQILPYRFSEGGQEIKIFSGPNYEKSKSFNFA